MKIWHGIFITYLQRLLSIGALKKRRPAMCAMIILFAFILSMVIEAIEKAIRKHVEDVTKRDESKEQFLIEESD